MAWYNDYRPKKFEEVIGQELVKKVLQNALLKNKVKHAYLFCGPKGVGKTTLARIFANNLNLVDKNSEAEIDILELDAASNTGIDNIRQLIESAQTPPINGKYKIYIIDEVHMLSKSAMNAMLKILEEPPSYLVFLLATTNPEKLISTVISRLTKLTLEAHSLDNLISSLDKISKDQSIKISPEALKIIAKRSSGSQRDAINLLETVSSYNLDLFEISDVEKILGLVSQQVLIQVADSLLAEGFETQTLQNLNKQAVSPDEFLNNFLEFLLDNEINSKSNYSILIEPVAETISLQLPLTSIESVLALIQVKVARYSGTLKFVKQPISEKKSFEIEQKKTTQQGPNLPPSEVQKAPEVKQNKADLNEDFSFEEEVSSDNFVAPESDLRNGLHDFGEVLNDQDCPPILQMLRQDITFEKLEANGKLITTVSNGIFLGQLNSPKIKAYIENKIKEKLSLSVNVVAEIKNASKTQTSTKVTQPEISKFEIRTEKFEPRIEPETRSEIPKIEPKNEKQFYKIYKELPENIDPKQADIYKNKIPDPKHNDEWDSVAEEFFDFE
jgi:DNA polymerase III subunit gamma/tau